MTAYQAHQIVPRTIGDGLPDEGLSLLDIPGLRVGTWHQPAERTTAPRREYARCGLRPQPCAVKAARQFTRVTIGSLGAEELFGDAAVVISELVTNAVRYGVHPGMARTAPDARIELVLLRQAGHLLCVVTDSNPEPPVLIDPGDVAETGRGLCVVEGLCRRWGWTPLGSGRKAVWAALPLPPAASARAEDPPSRAGGRQPGARP